MTCLVPKHLKFGSSSQKTLATAVVNQKSFWNSIWLTGMFYNSFNLFECKDVLLAKDTCCFAPFIQTAVGRQLASSAKVHLKACQTSNV